MIVAYAVHSIFDFKHEAVIFEAERFALVCPTLDALPSRYEKQ